MAIDPAALIRGEGTIRHLGLASGIGSRKLFPFTRRDVFLVRHPKRARRGTLRGRELDLAALTNWRAPRRRPAARRSDAEIALASIAGLVHLFVEVFAPGIDHGSLKQFRVGMVLRRVMA